MIPLREELERIYTRKEAELLDGFRSAIETAPVPKRGAMGRKLLRTLWPDELELISKTHWIQTKEPGVVKLLVPNFAQRRFYKEVIEFCRAEGLPIRAVVLKARQLGFSTFIQAWQYEQCDRESHRRSMTVSYDDTSTEEMFQKTSFIRKNQWFPRIAGRDRANTLEFSDNGSTFYTKTAGNFSAGRSLTVHNLHCSELPMWEDATETLTGLLQAVPARPDTSIFYESTAKGRRGEFYDAWKAAADGRSNAVAFFAPWFWDPEYVLPFPSNDHRNAFGRSLDLLERRLGERHKLSLEQLHWRRYKIQNDLQGSARKFQQEYPSEAEEAFLTSGSPVFNQERIAELEHNATAPLFTGNIFLGVA